MKTLAMVAAAAGVVALAGCGSSAATSTTGASPTPGAAAGRGAAGEVAQVSGNTLIINAASGDITVQLNGTTRVQRTRRGSLVDLTVGTCVAVTGSRDSTGAVTASAIRTFTATTAGCTVSGSGFGGGRGPGVSPRPGGAPARTRDPNAMLLVGSITTVSATSITVQAAAGSAPVTIPTTTRITLVSDAATTDITVGDCVVVAGPRDSAATVTARTVDIVPPGPNGCTSSGGLRGGAGPHPTSGA